MIIKKDSEIVKAKVKRKSLALKAKKESSDKECSTSGSEYEEYAMASDSGEEDDEKIQDETCLVAQAPNEVCSESSYFSDENSSIDDLALDNEYDKLCKMSLKIITKNKRLKAIRNSLENKLRELKDKLSTLEKNKGVDIDCAKCHTLKIENEKLKEESTRLNKFEKSTHCLNEMLNNQKPSSDKLGLRFNSFEASSSGTKEIKFVKAQKKTSSDGGPINMGGPLNVQAAPKINMGPPPATPGSEKSVSFQKSILGPRPKHIIVNKVKIPVASDNEVKQFYKPLTKPGVGFSKTNFRSKTPPPRRVNNNYSRPKTPQPKRHVGRQNQPHGFPICLGVDLEPDEWIKDSGCSKHMTGNRKLFSTYKAYNGGNVIFGSNLRGNIIGKGTISNDSLKIDNVEHVDNLGFNLLSIGQICDNKCRVTFSEHDSEITKDGKVIGRGIRKKGLYVMKLGNKPKDKICLATIDENSTLWHRRLGHANMRLIQSLASKELVRNLPKLKFDQHFCDACKIGKQAHVSHKAKNIVSTTRCLELLHMDLFGPSAVRSYGGNRYTLVIVDDYSSPIACALDFKLFQMDVNSAFLDGFINEEVYVAQPPGFIDFEKPNHVYKLKNALYGLKQAPRAWYDRLKAFLIKHEYEMGMVDNTLFTKKKSSNLIIVQIYVDDIIFGSTCQDMCDEFAKIIDDEFEMSMMGELNFFLGLQIKQMEDNIFLFNLTACGEMLKKFGLEDSKPMKTPMSSDTKLTKDEEYGPYQTNPPSIEDIISSIRIDREGQVRRIRHEEEIDVHDYQILTREIIPTLKPLEEIIEKTDEEVTTTPSPTTTSSSPTPPNAPSKTPSTNQTSSSQENTSSFFQSKLQILPPSSNEPTYPQPLNPLLENILDVAPRPLNPQPLKSLPSLDITLSLSPITPLKNLSSLPSPSPPPLPPPQPPIMGHPLY
ncbi:retrovirus-related pol polyprotein from transposon TNT 1-94 [Tanacetum coccineum]